MNLERVKAKVGQLIEIVKNSSGGKDTLRLLLTNTLTEYTINDEISLINVRFARNNLKKFIAPNLTALDQYSFYQCTTLRYADLGKISSIAGGSFGGNHQLETIILRKADAVVSLNDAFRNCNSILREDYTYYCYFYVPKALIEEYKVATNWSNYVNRFRAIEDYPEITGGII